MDFLEKVASACADYKMIEEGNAVVIALSGGADSVSLLHAISSCRADLASRFPRAI